MPHFAKPFFRPARNLWYVQLDGKQVNLGQDRSEAFKTYHALMSARAERAELPPPTLSDGRPRLVVELVDQFLDFVQKHRAADTYRWYKDRLNLFCNAVPADLTAERLRPFHVQQWIDSYPPVARLQA
jgi:hypothetical protein